MSWLVQAAILGPNMNEYEQIKWNGKLKLELDCWFLKPQTNKKKYVTKKISKGGVSVINVQAILPPGTIAQIIFLLLNKISCFIDDLTTH